MSRMLIWQQLDLDYNINLRVHETLLSNLTSKLMCLRCQYISEYVDDYIQDSSMINSILIARLLSAARASGASREFKNN